MASSLKGFFAFSFLCISFITIKLKEQNHYQYWLYTTTQGVNMPVL